ncbi:MAG: hypothetical protein K2M76_05870 [Muribaculaceae bacterium]|nr:hypothetical protein [Muribaculaceae bacterium]
MKNVADIFKQVTSDPIIVFKENNRIIRFDNSQRMQYKKVHVDSVAVISGVRCDYMLTSDNEHEEHFIELKGTDVKHAIEQLQTTIVRLGEYADERHSYVVSTNQAPALKTIVQKAKIEFKKKYQSTLDVKEKLIEVKLT